MRYIESSDLIRDPEHIHHTTRGLEQFMNNYAKYWNAVDAVPMFRSLGLGTKIIKLLEYCDFENTRSILERVVISGEAMGVAPPNPNARELSEITRLTINGAKRIAEYRRKFTIKSNPNLPIPTFFVRTSRELEPFCKLPTWFSGAVSLAYPPIGSTFCIEAADYVKGKLGKDLGQRAVDFSYYHETNHTVITRYQLAVCRNLRISDLLQAATFMGIANIPWELAANEGLVENPISQTIFPDLIARLETPNLHLNFHTIAETTMFHPDYKDIQYPSRDEDQGYMRPFVMNPQNALVYKAIRDAGHRYRGAVDPYFTFTKHIMDYVNVYPLLDQPFLLPDGFINFLDEYPVLY